MVFWKSLSIKPKNITICALVEITKITGLNLIICVCKLANKEVI